MSTFKTVGGFFIALLAASIAAGSVIPTKAGTFEITQGISHGRAAKSGPIALANAYKKYGIPIPPALQRAAERDMNAVSYDKRATGSVVANSDKHDLAYLCDVTIGTPGQRLTLDFDTGSSDLWVFSTETPNGGNHNLYDPSSSSTAKKMDGETWKIAYVDGSNCSGDVYSDVVTIGGLAVQNQAVESAQQVSQQFANGDSDGLVGLGFSSSNTIRPDQQKTWLDNVVPQLDSALFTVDFKHDAPGSFLFGAVHSEAQNISYTSVDSSRGYWGFTSTTSGNQIAGIADTGTTLLLLDSSIVDQYYQQVPGASVDSSQGGYTFDCSTQLPGFDFSVGGGQITIPGSLLNYGDAGNGKCFGGLQSNNGGDNIFGDIALKAAYVIFDIGNMQLGWAQK